MANQDDERRVYFQTVVAPAYQQYQEDPNSVTMREEQEKA